MNNEMNSIFQEIVLIKKGLVISNIIEYIIYNMKMILVKDIQMVNYVIINQQYAVMLISDKMGYTLNN